jgi:hypothetical protein
MFVQNLRYGNRLYLKPALLLTTETPFYLILQVRESALFPLLMNKFCSMHWLLLFKTKDDALPLVPHGASFRGCNKHGEEGTTENIARAQAVPVPWPK